MDCNIFAKEFTKKHGSPSFQKGKTNILDFTVGKEFTYAKFKMKDKNIVIKLGELYDGVIIIISYTLKMTSSPKRNM